MNRSTLMRLGGWFRPFAPHLAASVLLMAVAAAIPAGIVLLVEQILDRVLVNQDADTLRRIPYAVVGLYACNGAVNLVRGMLTRDVAFTVVARLRRAVFAHMLSLPPTWHQKRPLGERLSVLGQDVGQVQYLVSAFATAVEKPLALLGLAVAALRMDPLLAGLAFVALPPIAVPIRVFARRLRAQARGSLDGLGVLQSGALQSLAGLRVVQAFRAEARRLRAFDQDNERQLSLQLRAAFSQLAPSPLIELMASVGVALVIAVGGRRVIAGELQPGELIAILVALGLMNTPLKSLSEVASLTQRALAGAERAFEILDTPPPLTDGGEVLSARRCRLSFEELRFDYGEGEVLRGLSFDVEPGETVALVGASGAGKSTLASLVSRLADPTGGCVRVNGIDIRSLTLDSLRAHVAVVTQDPFLFDGSVAENLRLARPEASLAELEAACTAALAHEFVTALPKGYDTPVDEVGQRLSGGQRQRICIARALLLDAPILVLDEATSNLDPENEALVRQALARLREGRTTLVIAHRPETVREADRVVVLAQGRVVQMGPHAELIGQEGEYRRLFGGGA